MQKKTGRSKSQQWLKGKQWICPSSLYLFTQPDSLHSQPAGKLPYVEKQRWISDLLFTLFFSTEISSL